MNSQRLTFAALQFVVCLLCLPLQSQEIVTESYGSGDIPTNLTSYSGSCNGPLTVIGIDAPVGGPWMVTGIDIEYNMTAQGGGWKSHQRSRIHCQNTNTSESTAYQGVGDVGGVQAYERTGVNIANGTYPGGEELVFEMRAWRTAIGSGCNTTYNRVDNFSWTITVYFEEIPDDGAVGIGVTTTEPSALLELKSVQKGFLVPRMASNLRMAIANPAEGLMLYDTDENSLFVHNGQSWQGLITDFFWMKNGNSIYRTNGNVGIGDMSPAATFTVGDGDKFQVSGTEGDVFFADDLASIRFPASTAPNSPMIFMFSSGSQNADRMVLAHSPAFPFWGMEYCDTTDVMFLRASSARKFAFELGSGDLGIGVENPGFPIDLLGRMRLQHEGSTMPGIWFRNEAGTFDRALFGMSEPDSTIGIFSQHLDKWAIEFEVMREPRIGINITPGSPPRSEVHLMHTNFGGSNDGVRIQNEGANGHYWNLYTSNTTGHFEFYKSGVKKATIDATSGAYTALSDARFKTNISALDNVLPSVMQLQPKTYQFIDAQNERYSIGLMAQELEKLFPQFVYHGGDDQVLYTVDYAGMSVIALKAIQEQQTQIETLQKEIEALKSALYTALSTLENK